MFLVYSVIIVCAGNYWHRLANGSNASLSGWVFGCDNDNPICANQSKAQVLPGQAIQDDFDWWSNRIQRAEPGTVSVQCSFKFSIQHWQMEMRYAFLGELGGNLRTIFIMYGIIFFMDGWSLNWRGCNLHLPKLPSKPDLARRGGGSPSRSSLVPRKPGRLPSPQRCGSTVAGVTRSVAWCGSGGKSPDHGTVGQIHL